MFDTPPPPKDEWRTLGFAVLTAAACTLASGLVQWAVDHCRDHFKEDPDADQEKDAEKKS